MRIGVISDTHIPIQTKELPRQIIEDFKNVEMIIHAGDFVEIKLYEKLKAICPNIKAVHGNMDSDEIKNMLPEKEIFKIKNYKVGIIHGYGAPANLIAALANSFEKENVDLIIFGHSHRAISEEYNDILFFNPGSPTDKIFSPYNSYGIIEINDGIETNIIRI